MNSRSTRSIKRTYSLVFLAAEALSVALYCAVEEVEVEAVGDEY